MNEHSVSRLLEAFPQYAGAEQLLALPQDWLGPVNELFCDLRDIQKLEPGHNPLNPYRPYVDVQWLFVDGRNLAYVRPVEPHDTWTGDQALRLIKAIERFEKSTEIAA
ncbi:hypothetical protein Kim5_CH00828 [Rhizobium sp. Kim5]|uniref:hypothetical protein n=1 Tax=Rhizobium sp. Kim5 TaxID=2020311 RepID=UPI00019030C4|nr:hypothetical protein [Rhizobium sp. Kim5]ARQ56935.1 hypothetical protein Kim5_CH00828 [Rhizobium sp. Kim5]